jgi:bifunctional non-homologous end joining protein LigD
MPAKPPAGRRGNRLDAYQRKRDFSATPEPARGGAGGGWSFVVQEHHARSHHFDLRLEIDGVLASWAVPKGIPADPGEKRLAVHVEDHPLDYARFEGEIPSGQYGAGTVAVWDRGRWSPLERDWRKRFEGGKLKFRLHGNRLDGPYLLARMGAEPNWLLRKLEPERHRPAPPAALPRKQAGFIAPQLARPAAGIPEGTDWIHELKYDGYRIIAARHRGRTVLFTRTGLDWTARFGTLAARLEKLPGGDFVLDGEALVTDAAGRSDFGALQEALTQGGGEAIQYVAFDLLHHRGHDLRGLPLRERLDRLAALLPEHGALRRSRTWAGDAGGELIDQACKLGIEGIISKRLSGRYRSGERIDWVKSKCRPRQEFIVCGYTAAGGGGEGFGALVLASMERGRLVPRGKVGTGFSSRTRKSLLGKMKPLVTRQPPFSPAPAGVTWVRPELVAEIGFAGLTREGSIRQGSFISLREDKAASDVQVEPMEADAGRDGEVVGIAISHPGRIVFPDAAVTKLEVARYYERIAEWILPHVADRPLALLRAPTGISGQTFFQKNFKGDPPDHVRTKRLEDGTGVIVIRDAAGLVSLAQHGVIEIHPWGSRLPQVEKPDLLVWDLDPDASVPWEETRGAALLLRDLLLHHGIATRVKTSGGKGLHVVLHLRRHHTWETLKPFTRAVAARVARENPGRFTIQSSLARRKGRIYIDWLRNGRGATCIAPWSLRARSAATISTPLDWRDLATLPAAGFTVREPLRLPDDWRGIEPQHLPVALVREFTRA